MISFDKFHALLSPQELETLAVPYALDAANRIKLSGSIVFLCLLNGLLNHQELSQRLLEETCPQQTGDTCDHSSFSRCFARIDPAYCEDLVALLRRKLAPQLSPATERALHLRFVDATTVTLSAKRLHFGLLVRFHTRSCILHCASEGRTAACPPRAEEFIPPCQITRSPVERH